MRTTVNLEPEAYRLARALSQKRGQTVGRILSDALLSQFNQEPPSLEVVRDSEGWPTFYVGHVVTPEEVAAAIEE